MSMISFGSVGMPMAQSPSFKGGKKIGKNIIPDEK